MQSSLLKIIEKKFKMSTSVLSVLVIILGSAVDFNIASVSNRQPEFSIKAEMNKAFDKSCNIGTFKIPKTTNGAGVADCLEHCLANCRCKSFHICQNTLCELCSTNKNETASLLSEKHDCIYAMYEMQHLAGGFQKLDDQCSGMSCSMKYNCCQQSDLCPEDKICKPIYNITQPWKRFTCECPEGYHGDNCDEPITSCQGHYSNGARDSGIYKVQDSENSIYEVYCHFHSNSVWTLVQSYSFENYNSYTIKGKALRKPLYENAPINKNGVRWSGYRLNKSRMQSIHKSLAFLQFTCDYEKNYEVEKSDYIQIPIKYHSSKVKNIDVFELKDKLSSMVYIDEGKIGTLRLNGCSVTLYQGDYIPLHAHIMKGKCTSHEDHHCYFGNHYTGHASCLKNGHRCVQNSKSTTQLWFGHTLP